MSVNEILEAARKIYPKMKWHSFLVLPSDRVFGTWYIPSAEFDGADDMAFYKHFPLEITFFYRKDKKEEDFQKEKSFEENVRKCGEYSLSCGYDDKDDLFFSQYKFNLTEEI